MFVFCVAFALLGLWMLLSGAAPVAMPEGMDQALTARILGAVAIAYFGVLGVLIAPRTFDRRPGLIIDRTGVVDHSSALDAATIPWLDILDVYEREYRRRPFAVLKVRTSEKYIEAVSGMARTARRNYFRWFGSPIAMTAANLAIDHLGLMQALSEGLRRYGRKD